MAGPYELQSPKDIAMEYGGNKQKIAQAAQMGLVDPTAAVLAGMFIDKMRTAQQEEAAPNQTVAQQTFAPTQMAMAPAGLGATPEGQQMAPQMQQAPVTAAEGGLMSLDVPDNMYDGYAGGGIIAFANGGETDPIFGMGQEDFSGSMMPRKELVDLMTLAELQEYNRSGKIPPRLAGQVQGRQIGRPVFEAPARPTAPTAPTAATPAATAPTAPGAPVAGPGATQPAAQADDFASYLSRIEGAMPQGQALEGLEKDIKADREARKEEKSQAGWMSLAVAGLNVASGTSPFALVNLGKGLSEGLKNYAEELKSQKKLDREDRKMLADIEKARRDEKRGNVTAAMGNYEKALDRISAEKRQGIAAGAAKYAADVGAASRDPMSLLSRMKKSGVPDEEIERTRAIMAKIGVDPVLGG